MPKLLSSVKSIAGFSVDLQECPFREFKDSELSSDFWGMGPAALRAAIQSQKDKTPIKHQTDSLWIDDQIQPLPRSVRHYLHNYMRADELALTRFDADVVVFDDKDGGKISAADYMLNHVQVLQRSSFCRKVLSTCFILERMEGLIVEHQWDGFLFSFGAEGWRPKFHIYSPGLKPGGGPQHRPGLSKTGCYLVRLFYLGSWRCVWVNDQVPVDATGAPLLPFTYLVPSLRNTPPKSAKQPVALPSKAVQLWPLLLCKALLKIAVPDMNVDEEDLAEYEDSIFDEEMNDFSIIHALTGSLSVIYKVIDKDTEQIWDLLKREVVAYNWDEEDGSLNNNKSKAVKKSGTKDNNIVRRKSMATILLRDTENEPPFIVPGITPCHEMNMLIMMVRDLPLKKPLPEPEVPLWKTYRWVDWVKSHGLYKSYECPRTKFIKCTGLLKCSYAPHMMDVRSTVSINATKDTEKSKKNTKTPPASEINEKLLKDEVRDWVAFNSVDFIKSLNGIFFPSMLQFASASNFPILHPNKNSTNKSIDVLSPLSSPLYLQIDNPVEFSVKISLEVCHPRVLHNSGQPIQEMLEPATLLLEKFQWFQEVKLPEAKAFLKTRRFDSVDINLPAGRHFFRLWINYPLKWYTMILTEANLILGTQDIIQASAARDCLWSSKFLFGLSAAFNNWIRVSKSASQVQNLEKEFYKSYLPDLPWVKENVGYPIAFIHWMFRQALQSLLCKRLSPLEYKQASIVLRKVLADPNFGLRTKPISFNIKNIIAEEPCDCVTVEQSDKPINIDSEIYLDEGTISILLKAPVLPDVSQLCKLSSAEVKCDILRIERDKLIKLNEAAVVIQSYWRKYWVQKCFEGNQTFSTDLVKAVMDSAFNSFEALSALMNELFTLFPGIRSAYSVSSGLSGRLAFGQHTGTAAVIPKCTWIPLFQCLFFCHHQTNVNFDLRSNVQQEILFVFNNDTGKQLTQIYNELLTYKFEPNKKGFTVLGHSSLDKLLQVYNEVHWQLSILSSSASDFHICDGLDSNYCRELPFQTTIKLKFEEVFNPNRNNILGGLILSVSKSDCISFRAAVSSPEIDILATLKKIIFSGETQILGTCKGKGEIYWPCIVLEGPPLPMQINLSKKHSFSSANLIPIAPSAIKSERSIKSALKSPKTDSAKATRSSAKLETVKIRKSEDIKNYLLEVTAPDGWPLTMNQWSRVEEMRGIQELKFESQQRKLKERVGSARDKEKRPISPTVIPQPGDAYIELEVAVTAGGGVTVKKDDSRENAFADAKKLWDLKEAGRNVKGAKIRKEFRNEYLDHLPTVMENLQTVPSFNEVDEENEMFRDFYDKAAPTPISQISDYTVIEEEEIIETEEEETFMDIPEKLKDKFLPLEFVSNCTIEEMDEKIVFTKEKIEEVKAELHKDIETALQIMNGLEEYNTVNVFGSQKKRLALIERLFVDAQMKEDMVEALNARDVTHGKEVVSNRPSANKSKKK